MPAHAGIQATLSCPRNAGIQDCERRAVERRLSGRALWIPAFAGTTRMALGWTDRDETHVGSYDAFALTALTAYFSRKSRKKGCFGGIIGGIDGLASDATFPGFVFAGFGGALGSGGGSNGPYRPQAASISASTMASAGARARRARRDDNAAATSDSGWSPALYRKSGRRRAIGSNNAGRMKGTYMFPSVGHSPCEPVSVGLRGAARERATPVGGGRVARQR